ncbi:MAG: NUDIX hydrolase [Thermoanaerobaculia bacterium]
MRLRTFALLLLSGSTGLSSAAEPAAKPASALSAAAAAASTPAAAAPAAGLSAAEMKALLKKTATLRLAPDLSQLTTGERAAVDQLLQVGGILQWLYEDARHPEAERERNRLLGEPQSDASLLYRLFQGPIATTLDNRRVSFLPVAAEIPGKNVYPAGITAAEVESFLAAHPEERESILDDRTVVRRATAEALAADLETLQRVPLVAGLHPFLAGRLTELAEHPDSQILYAVPQAVAWARPLTTAYLSLLHAADDLAADDAEFAGYLRNRARDLLSNDYESGDASWVTGHFGRLNAQIGSYETYDDALFGVKAFPSMSLLLRDEAATAELSKSLGSLQQIEEALPYTQRKQIRAQIPIGVYEVIADFGQARGTNTATNLPNDPLHSRRYGRIILMRENIMKNPDLFANAERRWNAAVAPASRGGLAGDGGFQRTLWHEIGHYLGPEVTRDGRGLDQALQGWADAVEEMKADLVSLFAMQKLADAKLATPERLSAVHASGILRVLNDNRPRRDQPYQLMQLVQFNWYLDKGLLTMTPDGYLEIDAAKYAETVAGLLTEVLALQVAGDPAAVEAFFTRWTEWKLDLHEAIGKRMRDAQTVRYNLVRYAALGE